MLFPSVLVIVAAVRLLGACADERVNAEAGIATGPEASGQVAECTFRIVFASGSSDFTGDLAASRSVRGVPVTQTIIADLAFRIRSLDEISGIVASARGFVRQFIVSQDAAAVAGASPP